MKLLGKKAIVTGANRSIGRAVAVLFAQEGADIVISYRSDEVGAIETVRAIEQAGRRGFAFFADFSTSAGVRQFFCQAESVLGCVDILVNNAAGYDTTPFLELSTETFDCLFKVGVSAPMLLTQLAAQKMIQKGKGGSVINISSISGSSGTLCSQSSLKYADTKHGS